MAPSPLQRPRASALLPRHLTTTTPAARQTKRAETALRTPNHWTQPKPCGRSLQRAPASPLPRFPPAAPPSSALPCLRCASRPGMDPRSTFASTFCHAAPCAVPRRALRSALPHVGPPFARQGARPQGKAAANRSGFARWAALSTLATGRRISGAFQVHCSRRRPRN